MPDAPPQPDASHAHIGIVYALALELRPLIDRTDRVRTVRGHDFTVRGGWWQGVRVAFVEAGVGRKAARRATQALLAAHTPKWVIAAGLAGALVDDLRIGEIVMPDAVVDPDGNRLAIDLRLSAASQSPLPHGQRQTPEQQSPGLHLGTLLTADHVVRTVEEKRALAERHRAVAVDMETFAVAQVCRDRGTPFLAVRALSDDLSADLPREVLSVLGKTGSYRWGVAAASIFRRPSSVKDLWRLRAQVNDAAARLADFLEGVLPQLD